MKQAAIRCVSAQERHRSQGGRGRGRLELLSHPGLLGMMRSAHELTMGVSSRFASTLSHTSGTLVPIVLVYLGEAKLRYD